MEIESLADRSHYPCLKEDVYLNQASLGLIGAPAVSVMRRFLEDVARHGNLRMTDEEEVGFLEALRMRGAKLLGCEPDRLAILSGASELLGQLPYMFSPGPGEEIVAVATDFPAVTRPWTRLAGVGGSSIRFVSDEASKDLTESIIDSISDRTAVVVVSQVQFATGTLVDVQRLREATLRVGARLIIDVTQGAGVLKVDWQAWGADAVVTSGYKWLGGHGGVALGAISNDLMNQVPPLPGWMGAEQPFDFDATRLPLARGARRFTQSTMAYVSVAGLTEALTQIEALGQARVEAHARSLSVLLADRLEGLGWASFRSGGSSAPHITSIAHPTMDAGETAKGLRGGHIVCGARNGRIRISIAAYNNSEDIDALARALAGMANGRA